MWNLEKRTIELESCLRYAQINENIVWKWKVNENKPRWRYHQTERANCWSIFNKFEGLRKLKKSFRWYEISKWGMHKINKHKKWGNWKFDGLNGQLKSHYREKRAWYCWSESKYLVVGNEKQKIEWNRE